MDLKGKGGALFVPVPVGGRDIGHLSLQIQPKRMQYPRNIEEQAKNVVDEEIITAPLLRNTATSGSSIASTPKIILFIYCLHRRIACMGPASY